MSLDFTPLQWHHLSQSLHTLLSHHLTTLIQPQIQLQQNRILKQHKERDDPLELHDMEEYFEGGDFDEDEFDFATLPASLKSAPPNLSHIPKIYGLLEFISDLQLKRFSLGDAPPEIAVIHVEESAPVFGMEMAAKLRGELQRQNSGRHGISGTYGGVSPQLRRSDSEPISPALRSAGLFQTPPQKSLLTPQPHMFRSSPTLSHISEAPSLYSTSTTANWRVNFGPMTEILLRYYEQKNRQHSLAHLKSLQKESSLKTVIGSKKLPSRMNDTRVPNVDYSTLERPKTRKSPVKNLPKDIKEALELIGEGVTVRALVRYDSNAEIDIDTTIAFNEPVLKFIEIPISVHLYNLQIEAEIVATYHVTTDVLDIFLERNPTTVDDVTFGDTPIKDFDLTVDIGDPSLGPVLRDKQKIAGFIKEAMRDILGKKAIYPHQVTLERVLEKALLNFGPKDGGDVVEGNEKVRARVE